MFNIHFNCSGVAWMTVYLAMMKSFFIIIIYLNQCNGRQ